MPRRGGVTDHNAAMNNKAETNMATHQGHCFCGAVEIEVNGAPEAMGYCHCNACRSWSAAPVNAFTLWKPENVRVTTTKIGSMSPERVLRRHEPSCGFQHESEVNSSIGSENPFNRMA